MRLALCWILCTCVLAPLLALPAPLLPRTHEYHTQETLRTLEGEWREETETNPDNEEAWLQLLLATHRLNRTGDRQSLLKSVISEAADRVGGDSYAVSYGQYLLDQTPYRWVHYGRARAAQPERPDWLIDDAVYHELNGDTGKRKEAIRRLNTVLPFPEELLEYNYNQLQSVAVGAFLLTSTEMDTHASWLLQEEYGVRGDVTLVMERYLDRYPDYRRGVLDRAGVGAYDDVKHHPQRFIEAVLTSGTPIYFSINRNLDKITYKKNRVFLTGLAARYDKPGYRNTLPLVQAFRQKWRLAQLKAPRQDNRVTLQLDRNYLPALLELDEVGDNYSFDRELVRDLIDSIALRTGITRWVQQFLRQDTDKLASGIIDKNFKELEKSFAAIPAGHFHPDNRREGVKMPGFRMLSTEVTVADYQQFLDDLRRSGHGALANSLAIVAFTEKRLLPEQGPVVNIPRAGAEHYARWLGEVYNALAEKKGKPPVRFRLPTAQEFAYAARGGRKFTPYPWGGPYYRNSKGCALANFNTRLEQPRKTSPDTEACTDDTPLPALVDAYYPNNFELYNMSGNAAEMLAEEGVVTGGSWLDAPEDMRIGLLKEQPLPHPSTGFRLVMEYLD